MDECKNNRPVVDIKKDAERQARESRNLLISHLEGYPLGDPIWRLLADTIVDAKIEGYLGGLEAITDHKEMQAYERGYLDGKQDA